MAVDVSPEILEEIEKNFEEYYKDPNVKRIYKKIVEGTATYSDMQILSRLVAKHIYQSTEKAYTNALDSGKLPDDKLYQNIVDKTMRPTLKNGHGLIVEACGDVQTDLNRMSGIKLNAVEPELNESKVSGLIYQITNTNETRLSRTVLSGLIDTFCRSVVDDFVHANLDFQKESGFSPQISRTRGPNSNSKCAYCAALVYTGEYKGPGMPAEIFRRHRYCHCNVLYNPMNGKFQDVWAKQEYKDYREAEQKQRQYLNELDKMTPTERRLARNARARELRRAKYAPQEWNRRKALEKEIAEQKNNSRIVKQVENGIIKTTERAFANGPRRGALRIVTEVEKLQIKREAESIGVPVNLLSFNTGKKTSFDEMTGLINVRGDVFPSEYALNKDSILSSKAVLAHEYYGHYRMYPSRFGFDDWRDEFQASYRAAIDTPNLSDTDRRLLMLDAYDRAKRAGVTVRYNDIARKIIYGTQQQ